LLTSLDEKSICEVLDCFLAAENDKLEVLKGEDLYIPLYQSSNFILSPLNHSRSGTMFLGIIAYSFMFVVTGTSATDIASSDYSIV